MGLDIYMKKIAVSVVCYNNEDEVIKFAKELEKQEEKNFVFLVTVNVANSIVELKNQLRKISIQSFVYETQTNLGYLHGCIKGLQEYSVNNCYDWAFISNTDIEFLQSNFFSIFQKAKISSDVWCVAPNITLNRDKTLQNPFLLNRLSKRKMEFYKSVYNNFLFFIVYINLSKIKRIIKKTRAKDISSQNIYAAHGSGFFLKKDCVSELINNNDPIFMYGEELLVAEIICENNKKTYYFEEIKFLHFANQVTSLQKNRMLQKWFANSINYLYNRFY